MDIWKSEMESCCRMHLRDLYGLLKEYLKNGNKEPISLSPKYAAAPHDESLFDCMVLSIKADQDGKLIISCKVKYWHPVDGGWNKTADIRCFDDTDSCLEWLADVGPAGRECAEILAKRC